MTRVVYVARIMLGELLWLRILPLEPLDEVARCAISIWPLLIKGDFRVSLLEVTVWPMPTKSTYVLCILG